MARLSAGPPLMSNVQHLIDSAYFLCSKGLTPSSKISSTHDSRFANASGIVVNKGIAHREVFYACDHYQGIVSFLTSRSSRPTTGYAAGVLATRSASAAG